ncbi:MAG: pyruvate kinase [Candidatus Heimdallarchaeota archaeon]|nr:pyruvate kinase [Candidatus Heimdallarchaeota archaeon]
MKLSKIVCTIGPSSSDEETLRKMIEAGMDIARLNFSHGTHQSHEEVFKRIRKINPRIAIAIDISGPKIRLGTLQDRYTLKKEAKVTLTTDDIIGTKELLPVNYPSLAKEVKEGSFIYINDGFVKLKVLQKENGNLVCQAIDGGNISSRKGVNIPDANLSMRVPTEKDLIDIKKACELGVDYLFISYVRDSEDILKVKEIINSCSYNEIGLVSKIEHRDAIKNIQEITRVSDGLMVARGDLGIEVGAAKVPVLQKEIIRLGINKAKPVIVATQMLESMIREPLPTRAEASDVAHAVFDGADALMLSGETATGKHPIQVVRTMREIIQEAEKNLTYNSTITSKLDFPKGGEIGEAAVKLGQRLSVDAIVAITQTGYSASMISRNRVPLPIYAVTPDETTMRKTNLLWGVKSLYHPHEADFDQMIYSIIKKLHSEKFLKSDNTIIVVAGSVVGLPGKINTIQVLNVKETLNNFE